MIITNKIQEPHEQININNIFLYFYENMFIGKKNNKTFHLYENELPNDISAQLITIKENTILNHIKKTFNRFMSWGGIFSYNVYPINQMNELYLSKLNGEGSDHIFESPHVDGVFFFLPFCNVYRCILGISNNDLEIITHFPEKRGFFSHSTESICKYDINGELKIKSKKIQKYEYVAFDYNRDIHYISGDVVPSERFDKNGEITPRVIFKLHYIICPTFLPHPVVFAYKWIHIYYNTFMRYLFVNSQSNNSPLAHFINWGNGVFCAFYRWL